MQEDIRCQDSVIQTFFKGFNRFLQAQEVSRCSLRSIGLLGCVADIHPFLDKLTDSPLHNIARHTELDASRVTNFTGHIISVDVVVDGLSCFLCPLVYSDHLLTGASRHNKQLIASQYLNPCQLFPVSA